MDNDILQHAEVLADRREALCRKPPICPDCSTDQVQLVEWIENEVAEWKCRHCRTRFKFERITQSPLPAATRKARGPKI